jgi:hypothetical protein
MDSTESRVGIGRQLLFLLADSLAFNRLYSSRKLRGGMAGMSLEPVQGTQRACVRPWGSQDNALRIVHPAVRYSQGFARTQLANFIEALLDQGMSLLSANSLRIVSSWWWSGIFTGHTSVQEPQSVQA